MNPKRKNRLYLVLLILVGVSTAVILGTMALKENIQYYLSPLDIKAGKAPIDHTFNLAGLVSDGSVKREKDGMTIHFDVTDGAETIAVTYVGILPDLFREGQGIVATGKLDGSVKEKKEHFVAADVLAKHDETYMPPPVQDALDKAHKEGKKQLAENAAKTNDSKTMLGESAK